MYNRGTNPIDVCAGSLEFANALEAAWYLPFGELVGLKGNHHTLGLHFNVDILFCQQINPVMQIKQHGINSNNMKLTQFFCKKAIQACQQADIFNRIHTLMAQNKKHAFYSVVF